MKHILNNLSEQEKNSIREQHTGGMKVMTENFGKLLNSKLGDSKPIVEQPSLKNTPAPTAANQAPTGPITKPPKNFYGWKMCRSNSKGTLQMGNNDTWYMADVTDSKNTPLPSCMLGKLMNNYGMY